MSGRTWFKVSCAVLMLLGRLSPALQGVRPPAGAPTADEVVEFHFEHPQAAVPAYRIVLDANGEGTYTEGAGVPGSSTAEEPVSAGPVSARSVSAGSLPAGQGDPRIHAGPATLEKIFAGRSSLGGKPCETRQKNIANTGRKTLIYRGGAAPFECAFNYSDTPALNDVASTFIALAETLQAGERLANKHRFDRLGLDLEMEVLEGEVKGGRAVEVGNIRPVLDSIIGDDRVIERVRRRAARLLQENAPASGTVADRVVPGSSER